MDVTMIFTNSSLIPMDFVDELTLITNEHQPFKTLISDTPFVHFFLFLQPLLFFSFSLHSMDLFRQLRQHHFPFTDLAIELVITLVELFHGNRCDKLLTLRYYHISSLKGLVGQLANEFVITLVKASEWAPGIMKNDLRQLVIIRLFQKRIIGWLYSIQMRLLLLEIEDDAQWNSAENEDEKAVEWYNCKNGKDCFDRLGYQLDEDTIAPVTFQQLPVYLTSPRWQERLAGLVAFAEIIFFWETTIPDDISEQVVTVALNFFQHHPYPRVRRAAINAIDRLFYQSDRGFRLQCYRRVLPALAGAIYEDPERHVTSAAAFKAALYMYYHFDQSLPLSQYLCASQWQKRLVGLLGIAQIAKFRPWVKILNLENVLIDALSLFQNPPHPADRWAAIDVIGHLSNYVGPTFQVRVQDCVFQTLRSALYGVQEIPNNFDELLLDLLQNSHHPVKSATSAALLQLSNDLDPNLPLPLPLPFHLFLLPALAEIMSAFQYPGEQDAAAFVMIHISTKYPIDTSPYLRVTLGTLLEVRRREDIALDQTRIHEIKNFLEMFEARLPHETLTSTLDGLSPEQRVEFCAILLNEETYGE